ncbi:hypothetical protein [Paraliobacillus sediminis]|uniref:hypothetical protein n=1 Tax=Paraliobacillus sediminis TaxID=1885916 RepID=UPI000E3C2AD1|nr:hypothetical protein [Paraliobacillus sediminis]
MRRYIFIIFISIILFSSLIFFNNLSETTIKYFPIDDSRTFSSVSTKLKLLMEQGKDSYTIDWHTSSELDELTYLRQDIALLYVDGQLKAIKSKWKEQERTIDLQTTITGEDSSHYQAISFHHAEVHYPEDKIKSVQAMSHDELYVIDSPQTPLEAFKVPSNDLQTEWKETLNHATNQQLYYKWQQLLDHFQLNSDDYLSIPLNMLYQYETTAFPNLSATQTKKVIGQMWEGLYANYILPFNESSPSSKSFIPLILLDKEGTHLRILFQDHTGQMQQLIQNYSFENQS